MSRLPDLGRRGEGWFLLQLVMLAVVAAAGIFLGADWSGAPRFAAALAGVVLLVAGLALSVWGIRDLDVSISPFPHPSERGILIEHGVYDRVRHPIAATTTPA
jgi:protein-S-isoprenylcysteine O-methyltransferase Ste14